MTVIWTPYWLLNHKCLSLKGLFYTTVIWPPYWTLLGQKTIRPERPMLPKHTYQTIKCHILPFCHTNDVSPKVCTVRFCLSLLSVDKVCHCGLKKTWQAVGLDPGDGHLRTKNNPPTARKNMHCFCSQPNGKSAERWLSVCWCLACQVEKVSNGNMWPVG